METNSSGNSDQVQPEATVQAQDPDKTKNPKGSARTHYVQVQVISDSSSESTELTAAGTAELSNKQTLSPSQSTGTKTAIKSQIVIHKQTQDGVQKTRKRKPDLDGGSAAKKISSGGLEPVRTISNKPWPIYTFTTPATTPMPKPPSDVASLAPLRKSRKIQARIIIQQCTQAKVKTKPELDGADAEWAEILEGMVVYVSFFQGASEDVIHDIASSLMTTKLFRKDSRHLTSILDLPGSVLLVPQDSLVGEPSPKRRMQFRAGCEPWWGAQLFTNLVSACRDLMATSMKSAQVGAKVEQGVYGQKQEIILSSLEPLTVLLEF